jgi:hydrogenase small subunit
MSFNRREFLRLMGGTAAAFSFAGVMFQGCKKALKKAAENTPVIWLQCQSCSGCSVSLLNTVDPDIPKLITEYISLNFHQTVCGGTGDALMKVLHEAVEKNRKDFVLVVEGSIPTKHYLYNTLGSRDHHHIGADEWVEKLGRNAKAVIAVGQCATFGGIPAARGNVTGAMGVTNFFKLKGIDKPVINVAGCPSHPDWIVGTIAYFILKGKIPKLDEYNRPMMYFGKTVHENCENLKYYRKGIFAKEWGDKGCLYNLGCLGMDTGCDIPVRKWNDGTNSCTGSGSGCIGCTEPVYPDTGTRGLYKHLQASDEEINRIESPLIREAVIKLRKNGGVING